jgi:glycosyltransferase involved in cell wall biosynthesis
MSVLRVACYYPWVYLRSGVERTMIETITRSRHRWEVYTNHFAREGTYPEFHGLPVHELRRVSVDRSFWPVASAAFTIATQTIPMDRHDVLFVHSEGLGDFCTFRNHGKPVVCFCHTPLKVLSDRDARKSYDTRSGWRGPLVGAMGWAFRMLDRRAWQHYAHVFANSATVRQRIAEARLAPPGRVTVLHPGVDCSRFTPTGQYDRYFLALTRIKWWKNVELSIEAFQQFHQTHSNFRLVVAGQVDRGSEAYYARMTELARSCGAISFVRDPSADEVRDLYASCYAVLNTTLNEDWGMVLLEANAYAKPIIAVNRGGPCESQVHGDTGLLVPADPGAFARAMARLARDPVRARAMGEAGRRRVQRYDWSHVVGRLDAELESVAAGVRCENVAPAATEVPRT